MQRKGRRETGGLFLAESEGRESNVRPMTVSGTK